MAATKCIKACRHGQEVQLFFRPNVRMGKKCDQSDFDCGMIVKPSCLAPTISETGFSRTTVSRVCGEWCEKQKNIHCAAVLQTELPPYL